MPSSFLSFFAVFGLSVALTIGYRFMALRWGLVDSPDARKRHVGQVPLCGGLAMFSAFAIASALFARTHAVPLNVGLALFLLTVCGAADDRWRLSATPRLIVYFLAAAMILLPEVGQGINFGAFVHIPQPWLTPVGFAVCTLLIVGLINATNMTDGADGLCGGWGAAALFWLAMLARDVGRPRLASVALLLLAAVVGFLAFNMRHPWRSRASVFMGDAGSVALGGALGFVGIALAAGEGSISLPLLAWIVIVPMTDMASLVVRRLLARRSPMSADRWHLHHLMQDMGIPHATTVGLIIIASTLCGAVSWAGYALKIPDGILALGLIVPIAVHTAFVLIATKRVTLRAIRSTLKTAPLPKIGDRKLKGSPQ